MAPNLVAPQNVGKIANLEAVFSYKAGKTILSHLYYETPFKITRLHYPEHSSLAQVILMNISPGLLGGDQLVLKITVEPRARIMVNSQSSTKIHPSQGLLAQHNVCLDIKSEGELHYYNDPMIPFAQSQLQQKIEIQVEPNAKFYYWDGILSGRVLNGEQWKFAELSSKTSLKENRKLLYLDRFSLLPEEQNLTKEWVMGDFNYLANALIYDSQLTPPLCEVFQNANAENSGVSGAFDLLTTSLLSGRILFQEGTQFQAAQQKFRQGLFEHLLKEPALQVRK